MLSMHSRNYIIQIFLSLFLLIMQIYQAPAFKWKTLKNRRLQNWGIVILILILLISKTIIVFMIMSLDNIIAFHRRGCP